MRFTTMAQAPTIGAMTYMTYMTSAPPSLSVLPTLESTAAVGSASLNSKYPFGLSLSKPRAALRKAQRERFKWMDAE
jgi:hypothetical protein